MNLKRTLIDFKWQPNNLSGVTTDRAWQDSHHCFVGRIPSCGRRPHLWHRAGLSTALPITTYESRSQSARFSIRSWDYSLQREQIPACGRGGLGLMAGTFPLSSVVARLRRISDWFHSSRASWHGFAAWSVRPLSFFGAESQRFEMPSSSPICLMCPTSGTTMITHSSLLTVPTIRKYGVSSLLAESQSTLDLMIEIVTPKSPEQTTVGACHSAIAVEEFEHFNLGY